MAYSKEYGEYLLEMLEPLGDIKLRKMFGGAGIYYGKTMFALISEDCVYFKVDSQNKDDFVSENSEPFSYMRNGKVTYLKSYYQLPDEIMENSDELLSWSRRAVDAALRSGKK